MDWNKQGELLRCSGLDLGLKDGRIRVGVKKRKGIFNQTYCLLPLYSPSSAFITHAYLTTVFVVVKLLKGVSSCKIIN